MMAINVRDERCTGLGLLKVAIVAIVGDPSRKVKN